MKVIGASLIFLFTNIKKRYVFTIASIRATETYRLKVWLCLDIFVDIRKIKIRCVCLVPGIGELIFAEAIWLYKELSLVAIAPLLADWPREDRWREVVFA